MDSGPLSLALGVIREGFLEEVAPEPSEILLTQNLVSHKIQAKSTM